MFSAAGAAQAWHAASSPAPAAAGHSFRVEGGKFLLDGKPFQIIAGEMHYARIPREYWRARLRMAKAMGLNTITTYVFWNFHEPRPGVYDFTGQHDVAEFVREAQSEGLYVNLRPGPYSCAEWEWGGFPAWLLKDHGIVVRSTDPKFMQPARRWLLRLGQELAPLQVAQWRSDYRGAGGERVRIVRQTTTPTWSRFATISWTPASTKPCCTPPTIPRTSPTARCRSCRR